MKNNETFWILALLGGAVLFAVLMNNQSSQVNGLMPPPGAGDPQYPYYPPGYAAGSNVIMSNSETYEWTDYRGKSRSLVVKRVVHSGE